MTEERPMPQYGEYATPEQQAAAMGHVYVPPAPVEPPVALPPLPPATIARPRGLANRFLTVLLLAFGALTLFENVPALLDYANTIRGAATAEGLTITVPTSVDAAGIPTLIANIVLYVATLLVSVLLLRRGRLSFYVPIVGWVLFGAVSIVLILIFAPGFAGQFTK